MLSMKQSSVISMILQLKIELSNLNASDKLKEKIREEFKYIKELLDFDKKSHEIFRNWYVDGRLYYHKVIDLKKPQEGIKELRYIDPLKMRFVRQEKKKDRSGGLISLESMKILKLYIQKLKSILCIVPNQTIH
jgi:hypothetical protein